MNLHDTKLMCKSLLIIGFVIIKVKLYFGILTILTKVFILHLVIYIFLRINTIRLKTTPLNTAAINEAQIYTLQCHVSCRSRLS